MYHYQRPPLVLSGLVLGLVALGNLLGNYFPMVTILFICLAFFLYLLLIIGMIRHKEEALLQLKSPLVASVFPTFFMAGMLFASFLIKSNLIILGRPIWWLFCLGDMLLMAYYIYRFVCHFSWKNVFPSWTVLFVGIAMAALTAPASGAFLLGQLIFWLCLVATFIIFPIIYKKTYKIGLAQAYRPNISTFCAPLSLLLAGYLSTMKEPKEFMVIFLLLTSQAVYTFVLVQVPRLLNRPFNPGFSAFTFPFVISATSLRMAAIFLHLEKMLRLLILGEVSIATFLVFYVLVAYLNYLRKKEVSS